ncbi:MAG: HAD family phosphatase [Kiritimatiellae bacterium]|nr:HAD family phosphatase [Kiritimatiellia bacterium]
MDDIRIIALDLDGTLLDSDKNLSEANRAALAAAAAKGILVVPTTGRFFGMMPPAVRDLPFVRYAITVNGAQVYDRETDTAIVREELPLEQALAIMRYLDGFDVIYDCYQDNWGRMTRAMQEKAEEYAQCPHYVKMIREFRKPYPDLKEYLVEQGRDVQKIMLFARDPAVRDRILADIQTHFDNLAVSTSTFNNLEINTATAHKGRAIERFAAHFGWTLANCMAFGDGLNDLSMVKMAGTGVAMANAAPEVLAAADYVTLSNDDDGVAAALRHFLSL